MSKFMTEEAMAQRLEQLPDEDPAMREAIYTEYIERGFIIYDGRKNIAACTRCGQTWDLYPGEYSRMHGLKEECPYCGAINTLLTAGRGRQCYTEYHRLLHFLEHGGTLYGFLNSIIVKFDKVGRPDLYSSLDEVYVINKYTQERWHGHWSYGFGYGYESISNVNVPPAPTAPYTYKSKWRDHVWTDGLMDTVAKTDCKYALGTGLLLANRGMSLTAYFGTIMKYHSVELLAKAGFDNIAQWKIDGEGCRRVNWRANSLEKILKLPRRDIKRLRLWDPTCRELELYQNLTAKEREMIDLHIMRDMLSYEHYDYRTKKYTSTYVEEVEKFMPFDKWCRWAKIQDDYRDKKVPYLLRDYKDYIRTAEQLGMDIHKKSILRPADLKQAHDEAVAQLKIERDSLIDKAIAENALATEFTFRNLTIIPAKSQEDLNKESAKLCHCVKTYGDRVARGSCLIFFVRDTKAPDEPYYTLETSPRGEFRQCRGLHNCSMTEDVKLFTDAFVKKLKTELKKEGERKCQTA